MIYIQAGGKKRPIHTGSYMLNQFCKANGMTLEQLGKDFESTVASSTERAISFLYYAFLDGCRIDKVQPEFEEADIWDWIDADPEIAAKVYEAFAKSLPQNGSDAKKKKVAAKP